MAGNAIGLGNFLRFPVQAVRNGGGAFIIPYLVCLVLMGIPLLWVEWSIGRRGGRLGYHSTPFMMHTLSKRPFWKYAGVFGIFNNLAIASYYCFIESWTLAYVWHSLRQTFTGLSQSEVVRHFDNYVDLTTRFLGIPGEAVFFFLICVALNTYVLSRGLKGIERVATAGVPLLILFGLFLAGKALTLGSSGATEEFPDANSWAGLEFLWKPQYHSLSDPKVWLAAAGQIFFTISVGWGMIHAYASYVRSNEDIALNGLTAGMSNEFVEIVLGSLVVVPIAAGYLGIGWVTENISFGAAFQTMPFLFGKWGPVLATFAGVMWFGLLFLAAITSSLAMGMPWMGFMRDEFNWSRMRGAVSFGVILLMMGLPTVFFYRQGFFDEYDYWAGTVSLVLFALLEIILFAWVFGIRKGWNEIVMGADIRLPGLFRYVIKYVTPLLILSVLVGAVITPEGNDWLVAFRDLFHGYGWKLDDNSLIMQLTNSALYDQIARSTDPLEIAGLKEKIFFRNMARLMLLGLFAGLCLLVRFAFVRRGKQITEES